MSDRLKEIEAGIAAIERLENAPAREAARAIVKAVLELHGEGLARIVEIAGKEALAGCAHDPLASSLLLLHDLHPLDLETRVRHAAATLQGVEVTIEAGRVYARVGAGIAPAMVEARLLEAAPDAAEIRIDAEQAGAFVPVDRLRAGGAR
jgi:hypothetical protein